MNFPPDDLMALIRHPPPEMRVQFDNSDRFWFALTLLSLYNPTAGGLELEKVIDEVLGLKP